MSVKNAENNTSEKLSANKNELNERFGEHRRSILNHNQLINPTPISEHLNQPGHSINDVLLTPLELIHNNRDSVRKAREAYLIDKAMTLEPRGMNRGDELNYSGIPIFRTSKGNGNWFEKSGVRKIEGGIKSHLFYRGMVYKIQEGKQQLYITLVNV